VKFASNAAPHWLGAESVAVLMRQVLYALVPALIVLVWFFGAGIILNILVAAVVALGSEALVLRIRKRPVGLFISDYSALVTAVLLAMCLPPLTPWWITATGTIFAIVFAKHLYGGLGYNVFNPAMVGYAVLLVSFPEDMAAWPLPRNITPDQQTLSLFTVLQYWATGSVPADVTVDALSAATPLNSVKGQLGMMRTMPEIVGDPLFGNLAGHGWEWINAATALGGGWLLYRRIIRWQIPTAMLAGLLAPALVFYIVDPATHPSPAFHLLSGGTMLGIFFIATDPVSAAASNRGRLIYGLGIGIITYVIRNWGAYPDGIAFAVLLMNLAVPVIDRYTRPRIYGHRA